MISMAMALWLSIRFLIDLIKTKTFYVFAVREPFPLLYFALWGNWNFIHQINGYFTALNRTANNKWNTCSAYNNVRIVKSEQF